MFELFHSSGSHVFGAVFSRSQVLTTRLCLVASVGRRVEKSNDPHPDESAEIASMTMLNARIPLLCTAMPVWLFKMMRPGVDRLRIDVL